MGRGGDTLLQGGDTLLWSKVSRGILHFEGHLLCDRSRPGCNGASRGLRMPACYIPQAEFCESCTCVSALIRAFKLPPNAMNII